MEDDQKKRDHPVYAQYCYIVDGCHEQARKQWVDKKYSLLNLFWLGVPLIWKEHSAKIRNKDNDVIGFYRGHFIAQDGFLNFLVYNHYKWLIFEDTYVIKCPYIVEKKVPKTDEKGNILLDAKENPILELKKLDFRKYIRFQYNTNNDILLYAFNLENYSYFRYPVYITEKLEPIDLRSILGENVIDMGQSQLVTQVYEDGAKMSRKAMEHNPNVNYERMTPEKQKQVNPTQ
jgi:hypothetical protein